MWNAHPLYQAEPTEGRLIGMSSRPSSPSPRRLARAWRWSLAHPVIAAVVVVSGLAAAAITVTYTTTSTVTTGVTPPPIQFVAGNDAGPSALTDYVTAYSISTNKTYITSTVKGVPEATLLVDSFFKLQNIDDVSHPITLSAPNVTNSLVTAYTIDIYDNSNALVDTLDLREAASPVTATATIPASTTYYAKLTLTLAPGAGANNVALTNALTLTFT